MRVQPLHQIPKGRSESAKGTESVKGSTGGIRRLPGATQFDRTHAVPADWQEHGVDPQRDRVNLSDDAKKWQEGQWLDEGLKRGEDPKATAQEVIRDPKFAQQAAKIHKPRVQLREMAKRTSDAEEGAAEGGETGQPQLNDTLSAKPVDPKIEMASRHAPLESMLHKGPKTLSVRGNLSLPGGQNLPLTASFEMGEGNALAASFMALAG